MMSDTLPNIPLTRAEWVDLYDASGIEVGTAIEVDNIGDSRVLLAVRAGQPPVSFESYNILHPHTDVRLRNSVGDPGAWALSAGGDGKVNVRVLQ